MHNVHSCLLVVSVELVVGGSGRINQTLEHCLYLQSVLKFKKEEERRNNNEDKKLIKVMNK